MAVKELTKDEQAVKQQPVKKTNDVEFPEGFSDSILKGNEYLGTKVVILPTNNKISNRSKIFPGSKLHLRVPRNRNNKLEPLTEDEHKLYYDVVGENQEEFFKSFEIIITSSGLTLDLSISYESLIYTILKKGYFKQVSLKKEDENADTLFYLSDPTIEAKDKNLKRKLIFSALSILEKKLTADDKFLMLSAYGKSTSYSSMELADSVLYDLIEDDPEDFVNKYENMDHTRVVSEINLGIEYGVINKSVNSLTFGDTFLGMSENEVIDFLRSPKNQQTRQMIVKSTLSAIKSNS